MHARRWTVTRAVGLLGGCVSAVRTAWWLAGDLLRPVLAPLTEHGAAGLTRVSFAQALDAVCATVLLGCVCWVVLGTALTLASYAATVLSPTGSTTAVLASLASRGCPHQLRRVVLTCLGVAIGAGATTPAMAHPSGPMDRPGAHRNASADGVSGLALPDRTTGTARAGARHRTSPAEPVRSAVSVRTVLVRPGDSLWTIAARLLPPGVTDHDVTAAWHALHRANTPRIGADPDLILPGTRLGVPDQITTEREDR